MTHRPLVITTEIDGTPVVIKRSDAVEANPAIVAELERLRAAAHPGVVRVVAATEAPIAGFATAWAGSATLAITEVSARLAISLLARVASTLADLHARGVVHGRIEPSHVLVADPFAPVLCGFGSSPGGTEADDVAAIGTLLREAIGDVATEEPIPSARWRRSSVPDDGERRAALALADHATHPDPLRRPTSAALAHDLGRLAAGHRLEPPSPPASTPTGPKAPVRTAPPAQADGRRTGVPSVLRRALPIVGAVALAGLIWRSRHAIAAVVLPRSEVTTSARPADLVAHAIALLAATLGAYLVATAGLTLAGRVLGSESLRAAGERITVPALRSLLAQLSGASLSAAVAFAAAPGPSPAPISAAPSAPAPEPTIERLPDLDLREVLPSSAEPIRDRAESETEVRRLASLARTERLEEAPAEGSQPGPVPAPARPTPVHAAAVDTEAAATTAIATTWTVTRGDHLWSIAERVTGRSGADAADHREVASYWRALVAANPQLVDPDVIRPGEVLTLPRR